MKQKTVKVAGRWSVGRHNATGSVIYRFEVRGESPVTLALPHADAVKMARAILDMDAKPLPSGNGGLVMPDKDILVN